MKKSFSKWAEWQERNQLDNLQYPGVYAIAYSKENISGSPYSLRQEIIYFGMTNAKGGLKSRLRQFEDTIKGKTGHGGAHRVRLKHTDYHKLTKNLYVSIYHFKCNVLSNAPEDLRVMGYVAKFEYECFADYIEVYGNFPEFNDKKRSPKK